MFPSPNNFSLESMMQQMQMLAGNNPNMMQQILGGGGGGGGGGNQMQDLLNNFKNMGMGRNPLLTQPQTPDEIIEYLKMESELARETEKRTRKTKPYLPERKTESRRGDYTIARKNASLDQAGFKQTYVTANKHSSKVSDLSKLQQVFLKTMRVNEVNFGKYLICRVIEKPYQIVAMTLLVEDENGYIEDLSIYNYPSNDDVKELFPIGTVIYVKEPFLKITRDGYGRCIRIDSPSDIIVDDYEYSGKFKTQLNLIKSSNDPEVIKQKGNEYYKNGKFDLALRCYKVCLNLKPNQPFLFHLNCAAAFLGLELYFQAYSEANIALTMIETSQNAENNLDKIEKAYYRMGFSAYKMRQWQISEEKLSECLKANPKSKEASTLLQQAKERIQEQKNGKYNFLALYKKAVNENCLDLDVADYQNEDFLQLNESKSKGRHVIAKKRIPRGTLLIVSKAFSYGIWDENGGKPSLFSTNMVKNTIDTPSQNENLLNLFKRVQGNPFLAKEVYSLYSSDLFDRNEVLADQIVDVSRLECISSFNSFSGEDLINTFLTKPVFTKDEIEKRSQKANKKSTGVWIYPSLLNHACFPNTQRCFIGDIMVIFASKDIQENEEITNTYVCPLSPYEERQKHIKNYNFKCLCELCEEEEKDQKLQERERIFEKMGQLNYNMLTIDKIQKFYHSLEKTYSKNSKFKFALIKPLGFWQNYLYSNGDFIDCAEKNKISYEILKNVAPDVGIVTAIKIKQCYDMAYQKSESLKWWNIVLNDDFFRNETMLKLRFREVMVRYH